MIKQTCYINKEYLGSQSSNANPIMGDFLIKEKKKKLFLNLQKEQRSFWFKRNNILFWKQKVSVFP